MKTWVRFKQGDAVKFGTLEGDTISVYSGDMFDNPKATGETVKRADVKLMTPCSPSKMVLLWNNFYALSNKLGRCYSGRTSLSPETKHVLYC